MIEVLVGSLAERGTEGVLRPVRADLVPVSRASRDIGEAAGEVMTQRLHRMGSLPVGGAVITPGAGLPCAFVIHAVVSSEDEAETTVSVQMALRNGLRRAVDMGLFSLSLPPLGMGVGNLEPEDAARVMCEILFNHLDEGSPPLELSVVATSDFEAGVFRSIIASLSADRAG